MTMKSVFSLSNDELQAFYNEAKQQYSSYLQKGISINMARGKPSPQQLDLSNDLLNLTGKETGIFDADGNDVRNYGGLCGIPECRALFGEIMGVPAENVIAAGASSLNLMYDFVSQCCTHGTGGFAPWIFDENRKFIAIVPGYDRHFAIAEHFGLQMISVPMTPTGPDMDKIDEIVKDPSVKGMFCVPKYSNPDGITYSPETVERIAAMQTAAPDFRVIWDEAYIVHDLYDEKDELANVFSIAEKYGTQNRFFAVSSTSKITFAGAGVSAIVAFGETLNEIKSRLSWQIISYDKMNQLRHCTLYHSAADIQAQMKKHAAILRPKFDAVLDILHAELDGLDIASFNSPRGGYFISLNVNTGSAKYVGRLCRECGLTLTGVGATYPYGIDPNDANIRIAPSCPSVDELKTAAHVLCAAVKIAACEAILGVQS